MLSSPVTCWNEQDGTVTASVVGGFQPIEYLWSDEDAQTTATATGLYERSPLSSLIAWDAR